MEKLKWHYDKKIKQWWINEHPVYANNGFTIERNLNSKRYSLMLGHTKPIGFFNKLSSAKTVANLLRHG